MKIKVKGPIVIELTDIEFDTKETFTGLMESVKGFPLILGAVSARAGTNVANLPKVAMKLSKEELVAFATQMKIESLDQMIKDLADISKRRKEGKTSA